MTNANPLHHFQMPAGSGFIVKKSSASIQRASGSTDCISRSRSRNLSVGDQSCTDSRRKTTTTPAKPASATAIWAAVLRASLGSVEISFSAKCGVMRAKIHGSLKSPLCWCVSITNAWRSEAVRCSASLDFGGLIPDELIVKFAFGT